MPFKHKLSKRLALSRIRVLVMLTLVAACDQTSGPPQPLDSVSLLVLPQQITVPVRDSIDFRAYSVTASGDTVEAKVAWSVSGDSIQSRESGTGRFRSGSEPGQHEVVAKDKRGNTDTATVIVSSVVVPEESPDP
jgi:hypothetical protein